MNDDALNERPHRPVEVSNFGCTSASEPSWKSSTKLLPRCAHMTSTSHLSLMTCWSASFQNGPGPVVHPALPNSLATAFWRTVVSIGRRSDASRALRSLTAQVFWKLKRLLLNGT